MRQRILAVLVGFIVVIGAFLAPVAPANSAYIPGTLVCWSTPDSTEMVFSTYKILGTSADNTFLAGKVVKNYVYASTTGAKNPGCTPYQNRDIKQGDRYYNTNLPVQDGTPVNSPNTTWTGAEPTPPPAPEPPGGQICIATEHIVGAPAVWWPYMNEGTAYDKSYLTGKLWRDFPNSVVGCDGYNDVPVQEWEQRYGMSLTSRIAPGAEATVPDGTYDTNDMPGTPGGEVGDPFNPRPVPAGTLPGCEGKYRKMAQNWSQDTEYWGPTVSTSHGGGHWEPVRLTATISYWYCPYFFKMKVTDISFCVTHWSNRPAWYRGVRFNAYIADTNTVVNPGDFDIPKGEGLQQCGVQHIPSQNARWMRYDQKAEWSVSSWIQLWGIPDQDVTFKLYAGGPTRKRINPGTDVALSDWYVPN